MLWNFAFVGLAIGVLCPAPQVRADVMRQDDRIQITVDPRIELLAIVQSLSDYRTPDGRKILSRLEFPYGAEIDRRFADFRSHEAVGRFTEMSKAGFWFGQPPAAMLSLSDPPELKMVSPIDELVLQRAGGQERLLEFIGLLRRFSLQSDFVSFYESQRSFYEDMVQQYEMEIRGFHYVTDLETYYGCSQEAYTIILAPLYHPGGFGIRIQSGPSLYHIYNVSGPYGVTDQGIPEFGDERELRRIVWHEFGHSFVNSVVEDRLDLFMEAASTLCADMREQVAAAPNASWELFVHEWISEHLVRAVTTRLAYRELGTEAGDAALEKEKRQGYLYVGDLARSLEMYEEQRDRYPTFATYLPKLAEVFSRAASMGTSGSAGRP